MQNEKGGFHRSTNLHVMYRERRAKLRKPPATMQSTPSPCSPFPLYFFPFFSVVLRSSSLPSSNQRRYRVFRARLRFRSLDAEGRLIVAPFLSAVFTAAGNPPSRWKNEDRSGEGGQRRGTIDFSAVHVTIDQLPLSSSPVAFRELSISVSRIFLFGARKKRVKERSRHAKSPRERRNARIE